MNTSRSFSFARWYRLTAMSGNETDSLQREQIRVSRLLSLIVFYLLGLFLFFLPACFFLPNHFVILADIGMLVTCVVSLILNRNGYSGVAGWLITLAFEAAIIMVIFTTQPLDGPSVQQYEMLLFGPLLAVSLLPARSVFFVALLNIGIVMVSLTIQPHTALLNQDLRTQFWPMYVRPVGIQFLVALVTYIWVTNAQRYLARAYQAEETATKAKEQAEQEKTALQHDIESIVSNHARFINTKISIQHIPQQEEIKDIPLQQYRPVLWPLINVFNSLRKRLRSGQRAEYELEAMKHALTSLTSGIQNGGLLPTITQPKSELEAFLRALQSPHPSWKAPASFSSGSSLPLSGNVQQTHKTKGT